MSYEDELRKQPIDLPPSGGWMIESYADLQQIDDRTLVYIHDEHFKGVSFSYEDVRGELARRSANRANSQMLAYTAEVTGLTRTIHRLTWVITGLTAFGVIASIAAIVIALVK